MQNPHTEAINFRLVIAISLVATIGGFLFGFDSGVINGTVSGLQSAFNSDSMGTGFNVASMLLGCAVGGPEEVGLFESGCSSLFPRFVVPSADDRSWPSSLDLDVTALKFWLA